MDNITNELSNLSIKTNPKIYNINDHNYLFNSELTKDEEKELNVNYDKLNINKYLSTDKNYLDIGSGFGLYPIKFAEKVKTIYTFEPDRILFNQLCGNIYINNIENILPFNYGLHNYEGKTTMNRYLNINEEIKNNYRPVNSNGIYYEPEPIFLQTLDSFKINNLCLIKINTNELNTLLGGKRTLELNNYPPIIMNNKINKETIEYLKFLGYQQNNMEEFCPSREAVEFLLFIK